MGLLTSPVVILFAVVTILVTRGITQGEPFYHIDEMSHAMMGVFFRDLLVDMAWRHPLQYVYDYYSKYPSLMFPYWPPLFHLVEGAFFLIFGISVLAGRLSILLFALLSVYFWYRIALRLGPRHLAFLSSLLFMSLPLVLFQTRVTMLEIPALATCLGVILFWLRFLDTGRRSDLWALAGLTVAAFLTSQKAIFLVPLIIFGLIVERRFSLLARLDVWIALVISLIPVVSWYAVSFHFIHFSSHVSGTNFNFVTNPATYTFYLTKLRGALGPVLGVLAVFGLVVAAWKRSYTHRFLLTWVVAGYLSFTFIKDKDVRYTLEWLPPLIYLALLGLETLLPRRSWAIVASSALTLFFLVGALRTERPIVSGIKDVAAFVVANQDSDVIYFQGHLDRDFIFFVRQFDPQKRRMIVKQTQIADLLALDSPARTLSDEDEILKCFQTMGIRYAVIQDGDEWENPAERAAHIPMLNLLQSDKFDLVKTFPVQTNQPNVKARQVRVFRYRGELHRAPEISIPVETLGQGVPIDLARLVGHPWPN